MSDSFSLRDILGNAIRYWEVRRIAYNLVLALIVAAFFCFNLPQSREKLTLDLAQGLFILAVLANVAYCASYLIDVFAQLSSVRATWLKLRWVAFFIGLLFASVITRYFAEGIFRAAV